VRDILITGVIAGLFAFAGGAAVRTSAAVSRASSERSCGTDLSSGEAAMVSFDAEAQP
jgi:hypothetical protein